MEKDHKYPSIPFPPFIFGEKKFLCNTVSNVVGPDEVLYIPEFWQEIEQLP